MTKQKPSRLISAATAIDEFDVTDGRLRALEQRGTLPVIRVGDSRYFEREDFERLFTPRRRIAACV